MRIAKRATQAISLFHLGGLLSWLSTAPPYCPPFFFCPHIVAELLQVFCSCPFCYFILLLETIVVGFLVHTDTQVIRLKKYTVKKRRTAWALPNYYSYFLSNDRRAAPSFLLNYSVSKGKSHQPDLLLCHISLISPGQNRPQQLSFLLTLSSFFSPFSQVDVHLLSTTSIPTLCSDLSPARRPASLSLQLMLFWALVSNRFCLNNRNIVKFSPSIFTTFLFRHCLSKRLVFFPVVLFVRFPITVQLHPVVSLLPPSELSRFQDSLAQCNPL